MERDEAAYIKLSVIIPVYNAEQYIGQCLDSVLNQSLKELEVICVDDASTDSSARIIRQYQKRDSRVKLLKNETNLYAGICRNRGLETAGGEYIHFLDADDLVEEDAYAKYYDLAETYGLDVLKGRSRSFDNLTGEISTTGLLDFAKVPENKFDQVLTFAEEPEVFSHISVVPWNGIYRREFLLEKGIRFNHLICVNDRSFFNEVCIAAEKILLTRESLVRYRVNNQESLVGRRARNFECQFASYEIVLEQCRKYDIQGSLRKQILDRELVDLFVWYRRYQKAEEVKETIQAQTKEFLEGLDLTPFEEGTPELRWYYDYRMLMEPQMLTVAVYLEEGGTLLEKCLESIKKQSVENMKVYGISRGKGSREVFEKYAEEDERFVTVVEETEEIPHTSPYFFVTYPKVFQKQNEFEKLIKKKMKAGSREESQEYVLYQPKAEPRKGLFQRVWKKFFMVFMLMFLCVAAGTGVSAASKGGQGTWKKTAQGDRYVYRDGTYPKNTWVKIHGKNYHFNKSGILDKNKWVGKYYVRYDGTILEESARPARMSQGFVTREMLDEINLSDCYHLMVVAHPDDETLWGGGHLTEGGYFVVCLTNANKSKRKAEFERVISESGNKGLILSYPDLTNGVRNNWKKVKPQILSDLNVIMQYKKWATVVTHNPVGEYGHIHHIMTNRLVTYLYHKNYWVDRLYYFGKFCKKKSLKNVYAAVDKLPNKQYKEKKQLLKIYRSQKKIVNKMKHMHPYENWIPERDWK